MNSERDDTATAADQVQAERYDDASKDGVLRVIRRNIQVLKQEMGWGVKIDRSLLADMEDDYRRLEDDRHTKRNEA